MLEKTNVKKANRYKPHKVLKIVKCKKKMKLMLNLLKHAYFKN